MCSVTEAIESTVSPWSNVLEHGGERNNGQLTNSDSNIRISLGTQVTKTFKKGNLSTKKKENNFQY